MKNKTKKITLIFILTAIIFSFQILLKPRISNAQTAIKRSCWNAYNLYLSSDYSLKVSYMNSVYRCAENYLKMVKNDSQYCSEALPYANMILPNLATVLASQIIFECENR